MTSTTTKNERTVRCTVLVRHGLLYDLVDTNDELVSGRQFPELIGNRRSGLSDWRFFQTSSLGIVSPKTGKVLWIPRPVWFTPTFRHTVYPVLRPTFDEWGQDSYERTLTIGQLRQCLRSVDQFNSGKWHQEYCSHDDCPLGCGSDDLTPEEELKEIEDAAKYRGTPRRSVVEGLVPVPTM
jgi:hypothetical protein